MLLRGGRKENLGTLVSKAGSRQKQLILVFCFDFLCVFIPGAAPRNVAALWLRSLLWTVLLCKEALVEGRSLGTKGKSGIRAQPCARWRLPLERGQKFRIAFIKKERKKERSSWHLSVKSPREEPPHVLQVPRNFPIAKPSTGPLSAQDRKRKKATILIGFPN